MQRLISQGRWWFSQRRHTRDGILTSTAEHFFYYLKDDTDFSNLLTILAGASEFATLLAASTGRKLSKKDKKAKQAKVEELEKVIEMRKQELGVAESPTIRQESKVAVGSGPARRARALLWAHVLQVELDDAEMRSGESAHARTRNRAGFLDYHVCADSMQSLTLSCASRSLCSTRC